MKRVQLYVLHPQSSRNLYINILLIGRGYSGTVVTHAPPTSEVSGSNAGPYVGMLAVAYRWLAVYSSEA